MVFLLVPLCGVPGWYPCAVFLCGIPLSPSVWCSGVVFLCGVPLIVLLLLERERGDALTILCRSSVFDMALEAR